jgi:alpha,alpha-trehalase
MDMLTKEHETVLIRFGADEIAEAMAFIETKWADLTKHQRVDNGTLIGLPYPYVVPSSEPQSGFVFEEMYYWDSYFTAQGLLATGHHELAEGMLENLIFLFKKFHIIPNASRFYFTGHSQPPLLTSYIFDIFERCDKDLHWLEERINVAQREYETVWMRDTQPNMRNVHRGLSRYYDINVLDDLAECESGWDMTTRFGRQCLSHIPIDLNCLLYKYELDFGRAHELFGDTDTASIWRERARKRAETINELLWNEQEGFFFDLNYVDTAHSHVWSVAAYYALWTGLADSVQARRLVEHLEKFLHPGGLTVTSLADELPGSNMPHQWAYPNGWAPLHWLIAEGLDRYGYRREAEMITRRWLKTNLEYYEAFGVFREAYDVVSGIDSPHAGVYPPQIGFGWTNAVFVDLAKKYLSQEELLKV